MEEIGSSPIETDNISELNKKQVSEFNSSRTFKQVFINAWLIAPIVMIIGFDGYSVFVGPGALIALPFVWISLFQIPLIAVFSIGGLFLFTYFWKIVLNYTDALPYANRWLVRIVAYVIYYALVYLLFLLLPLLGIRTSG